MMSDTDLVKARHLFSLGIEQFESGNYLGSSKLWQEALVYAPDRTSILVNLSIAQLKLADIAGAAATIKRALEIDPSNSQAWKVLNEIPAADRAVLASTAVDRQYSQTLGDRIASGRAALTQHKFDVALECFGQALEISPRSAPAVIGKLSALAEGYGVQAALTFAEATHQFFRDSGEFLSDLGLLRERVGDFDGAMLAYTEALHANPSYSHAKLRKGLLLLRLGQYSEGWPLYEARFGHDNLAARHERIPRLKDVDTARNVNVLVWAEQGLGDTLQFLRYIQPMLDHGINVFLEVPPELVAIVSRNIPVPVGSDMGNQFAFEFQIPLLSVAGLLWKSVGYFSDSIPYLKPDLSKQSGLPRHPRVRPQTGVVCSGNPKHANDALRSAPASAFAVLGSVSDLFLIQKEVRSTDLAFLNENPWFFNCSELIFDFDDTARIISEMDCVVSVDTSVAHLAGAMGKKVFLILPPQSDWRWGLDQTTTGWYPSMTILRLKNGQDLSSAMETLCKTLGELPLRSS